MADHDRQDSPHATRRCPSGPPDEEEVRFTPRMYLDYYTAERNLRLEDLGVAPLVVGTWFPGVTEGLARKAGASKPEHWPYAHLALFTGGVGRTRVSFATYPVGAPGTVALMEELAAAGARCFVGLGMAGSLQEVAPIGSFLLPGECLREEGTSAHYLRPGETPGPDPCLRDALERALTASGLTATRGWHWTTDAIYREFTWKIERYRAEGVLSVDMETSAMYAFGCLRRLPVANLLVVSDELWREWRPGFHSDELRRALGLASTAILDHLTELDGAWRGPTDV